MIHRRIHTLHKNIKSAIPRTNNLRLPNTNTTKILPATRSLPLTTRVPVMKELALGADAKDVDTVVAPGNSAERVADELAAEVVPGAGAVAGYSVHPAAAVCGLC